MSDINSVKRFWISDLVIVGFSSTVEGLTLPRVLAPVFRSKRQPDLILFPPMRVKGEEVTDVNEGSLAEFEEFHEAGKITAICKMLKKNRTGVLKLQPAKDTEARVNYQLWVDPYGTVSYDPKDKVQQTFKDLYAEHLHLANDALDAEHYERVMRHAAVARSADPRKLEPLILMGAAQSQEQKPDEYSFTQELASDIVSALLFNSNVRARIANIPK